MDTEYLSISIPQFSSSVSPCFQNICLSPTWLSLFLGILFFLIQMGFFLSFFFCTGILESVATATIQEKEKFSIEIVKKEVKLPLFADDMILYRKP